MNDQVGLRSVLFICTANQCRSPMAAALLKSLVTQYGEADRWRIQSAGTWAEPGRPATQLAQAVLRRRNLDLSDHRSRALDAALLAEASIVLVMTRFVGAEGVQDIAETRGAARDFLFEKTILFQHRGGT